MSKECNYCGFKDPMPFICKFCGGGFCYNHRLPESHNCPGLAIYKNSAHNSENTENYYQGKPQRKAAYRSSPFKPVTDALSIIKNNYSLTILVIVIISFILQYIIPGYSYYLALYPSKIIVHPWTLITHMFLHSGPIHILFNMLFLFFFGPELERRIGGKRFLAVFFISGIVAAIGYSLWSLLILKSAAPAVGASGALFGIFACLAILAPDIIVYVYFIPMKITYALVFFALLDLLFVNAGDTIARSAHLSGVIAGLIMGKHIKNTNHNDYSNDFSFK